MTVSWGERWFGFEQTLQGRHKSWDVETLRHSTQFAESIQAIGMLVAPSPSPSIALSQDLWQHR